MSQMPALTYTVKLDNFSSHYFTVDLSMSQAQKNQCFSLPAWTPGSYMIREFSQHIVKIQACENNTPITVKKLNKNTFQVSNLLSDITVSYLVYAFDSSIRAAYIDQEQAFFNGTALFLRPHNYHLDYSLHVKNPRCPHTKNWQVATALPPKNTDAQGFGEYVAKDYDNLVDCPVQIGPLQKLSFETFDTKHQMVFASDVRNFCQKRVSKDLQQLTSTHAKFFGQKLPFSDYLFITRLEEESFGGLEHANSSMLLHSPYCLPKTEDEPPSDRYVNFLSLCSHEYFHTFNIKRLRPIEFDPYDYNQECYTSMLWLFEGFTAYYDDLLVKRAKLCSLEQYFTTLAKNIGHYLKCPGKDMQSLAQASFDAWIKFYRPNENSFNTNISYYLKGGLLALYLDLQIRAETQNKRSLDDVMRACFEKYIGKKGITEEDFFSVFSSFTKMNVKDIQKNFIHGVKPFPFEETFSLVGVNYQISADNSTFTEAHLGLKLDFINKQYVQIVFVESGSCGMKAGLSPNDELLALNGIRVSEDNYKDLFASLKPHAEITITASRRKRLFHGKTIFSPSNLTKVSLSLQTKLDSSKNETLNSWLGSVS